MPAKLTAPPAPQCGGFPSNKQSGPQVRGPLPRTRQSGQWHGKTFIAGSRAPVRTALFIDARFGHTGSVRGAGVLYMGFPTAYRAKLHSTNPLECLNGEIKRRTEVVGIFPDEAAITRLIGAVLLEQNDE